MFSCFPLFHWVVYKGECIALFVWDISLPFDVPFFFLQKKIILIPLFLRNLQKRISLKALRTWMKVWNFLFKRKSVKIKLQKKKKKGRYGELRHSVTWELRQTSLRAWGWHQPTLIFNYISLFYLDYTFMKLMPFDFSSWTSIIPHDHSKTRGCEFMDKTFVRVGFCFCFDCQVGNSEYN